MPLVNFDAPITCRLLERSLSENSSYKLAHVLFTDNIHEFLKHVWKKRMMVCSSKSTEKSIDGNSSNTLVLVEKRQELLQGHKRAKCHYEKSELNIWHKGSKQEAARKVLTVSNRPAAAVAVQHSTFTNMTEDVLNKKKYSPHRCK